MDFTLACWPVFPLCLVPKEFSRNEPSVHFVHNRLTLAQQGLSGALLVSVSLPWSKNLTQGHTDPNSFFCSKNEFTPPPKGEGLAIVFLRVIGFSLLVHNRLARLQRGLFRGSLVSFPLLSSQNRTQGHMGLSLVSTLFLHILLLYQG